MRASGRASCFTHLERARSRGPAAVPPGWVTIRESPVRALVSRIPLLFLAGCVACPDQREPDPPATGVAVLVAPENVLLDFDPNQSGPGRSVTFTLEAFTRDAEGTLREPDVQQISWSAPTGVSLATEGSLAHITIDADDQLPVTINATVAGIGSGSATIAPSPAAGDQVYGSHVSGALPSVALASGSGGASCVTDVIAAFVWRGSIPDLNTGTCRDEVLLLWSNASPRFLSPVGWQNTADQVNAGNVGGMFAPNTPGARLRVSPKLFIGVTDWICTNVAVNQPCSTASLLAGARAAALDQFDYANSVLERNRVGIELAYPTGAEVIQPLHNVTNCGDVPITGIHALASGEIAIYLLDHLAGLARGWTCSGLDFDGNGVPDADRKVILISYPDTWVNSVLVHELGHVMGLRWPGNGHTNAPGLTGFGLDNVMAETDGVSSQRFHFTLGQTFRMNVDSRGWIAASGFHSWSGRDCGCDPVAATQCPALFRDIAPLERSVTWGGTCP